MKTLRIFVAALILSFITPLAFAAGEGTTGDYFAGLGKQLGRGVWNVLSSPAEIPCTMNEEMKIQGGTGVATGLGKGLVYFGRRVVVGVSELLTFVLPSQATLPTVCSGKPLPQAA